MRAQREIAHNISVRDKRPRFAREFNSLYHPPKVRGHSGRYFQALTAHILGFYLIAASGSANAAPTREVANVCRVLAYKAYPYQRPGSAKGSGARYEFFKDCVAKEGKIDVPRPAPALQGKP